jgi:hypothetical protein
MLENAEQLASMYKQELKSKSRELLWLKQQTNCFNNNKIHRHTKE